MVSFTPKSIDKKLHSGCRRTFAHIIMFKCSSLWRQCFVLVELTHRSEAETQRWLVHHCTDLEAKIALFLGRVLCSKVKVYCRNVWIHFIIFLNPVNKSCWQVHIKMTEYLTISNSSTSTLHINSPTNEEFTFGFTYGWSSTPLTCERNPTPDIQAGMKPL